MYGTAGVAFGGVKDHLSLHADDTGQGGGTVDYVANSDGTLTGYVVGAGVEYSLSPAWSLKAEYQYLDLGSSKETILDQNLPRFVSATEKVDHTYNTVRVGLNYHVGAGFDPLK